MIQHSRLRITGALRLLPLLLPALLLLGGCRSAKKVSYFQYSSSRDSLEQHQEGGLYSARIKPKDLLTISVVSGDQEASRPYNLLVPQIRDITVQSSLYSQPSMQPYLVEEDGSIDFPVLGKIEVAGMKRTELESHLLELLKPAFSGELPIVTVHISNYSVHVLGEVARPGKIAVSNDRITLLEALSQAGDMTLYGRRESIRILREGPDGKKEFLMANLNDKDLVHSPAYYLEQNDVVYVEPNKVQQRTASIGRAETLSISVVGILISVASLVVNVLK